MSPPDLLRIRDPIAHGWIMRCWPYWQTGHVEEYLSSLSRVSRSKCIAAMRIAVERGGVDLPIPEVKRGRPCLGNEKRLVYPPVVVDAMNELLLRWGPAILAKTCRGQLIRYGHGWMLRRALNTNACRPGNIPRIGSREDPGVISADLLMERFLLWGAGEFVHTIPVHAPLMPVVPGSMIPLSAGQIRQTFPQMLGIQTFGGKQKTSKEHTSKIEHKEQQRANTAGLPEEQEFTGDLMDDPWLAKMLASVPRQAPPPELLRACQDAAGRLNQPPKAGSDTLAVFQQLLADRFAPDEDERSPG